MKFKAILVALTIAAVSCFGAVSSASASSQEICGNGGSGYCLNDWGGADRAGDAVKMEYGNGTNENFLDYALLKMCGSGKVTSTCPNLGLAQNELKGFNLVEIVYGPGGCVADNGSGYADLGTCPDQYGNGGSNGTIYIAYPESPGYCIYYNRYWTGYYGSLAGLESGGSVGAQATDDATGTITEWGGGGSYCGLY